MTYIAVALYLLGAALAAAYADEVGGAEMWEVAVWIAVWPVVMAGCVACFAWVTLRDLATIAWRNVGGAGR